MPTEFSNPVLHAAQTFTSVLENAPGWTPSSILHFASSDALHLPFILTLIIIPSMYGLQSGSGNVSWVDRIWTTFPVLCSATVAFWIISNPNAGVYVASLPRIILVLLLQTMWSGRLTGHSYRRGVYNFNSEDYRYTSVRKVVPAWAFQVIHIVVICIAQPVLLLALAFPIRTMILPPNLLSRGPSSYAVPLHAFPLPASLHAAAKAAGVDPNTPVIHVGDVLLTGLALTILFFEAWGDNSMYAFQQAKHKSIRQLEKAEAESRTVATPTTVPKAVKTRSRGKQTPQTPQTPPVSVSPAPVEKVSDGPQTPKFAAKFFPGFPIKGIHSISRHPNFASEQLFWVTQGLFAVFAGVPVTRIAGRMQCALMPAFCLSLLFCASTALTEYLTSQKYPLYRTYSKLVGEFLPQETVIKRVWTGLNGTREALVRQLKGEEKVE